MPLLAGFSGLFGGPIGRQDGQPSQAWSAGRLAVWPLGCSDLGALHRFVRAVQLVQFALARRWALLPGKFLSAKCPGAH